MRRQKETPDTRELDTVIERFRDKPGGLLGMLEEIQELHPHKYLTRESLEYVSRRTGIPLSRIYSIVTFYTFFSLKPQGEHVITICRGTACHTRRSKNLLDYLKRTLGLKDEGAEGEKVFLTSADGKFTVKTVACFGQCALAPVAEVDGRIYSHLTEDKMRRVIQKIIRGGKT